MLFLCHVNLSGSSAVSWCRTGTLMYMSPEMFRGEQYTEKVCRGVGPWSLSVGAQGAREMGGGTMRVREAGCQGRQEVVWGARASHWLGKGKHTACCKGVGAGMNEVWEGNYTLSKADTNLLSAAGMLLYFAYVPDQHPALCTQVDVFSFAIMMYEILHR